jgi:DNA-binding PadR family transcriptional regulator
LSIDKVRALAPVEKDHGDVLPLTPAVFHIMLVMAEGPRHGYGIMQEVEKLSEGRVQLGPGTLYRSLQRMLLDGLIEEVHDQMADGSEDERRRYYRLTIFGQAVVRAEYRRVLALVDAARQRGLDD